MGVDPVESVTSIGDYRSVGTAQGAGWTELLAAALAHDINNLALSLSSAQRLTGVQMGEELKAAEWAALVERDLDRLRALGVRLRALAGARESQSSAGLGDACAGALAEVDPRGGRVRRADSPADGTRVRGTAAAVKTAVASLLEYALAASPAGVPIELAVRPAFVEIAAPEASRSSAIPRAALKTLLDTALRDRRGDVSLVLPGAVADALGGAVYFALDPTRGLVLELQLVACPS
jgi:hypothetical protein